MKRRAMACAGLRGDVRSEWDEAKQHDVLFLLTLRPPAANALAAARAAGQQPTPAELYGLVAVRGCEVIEVRCSDYHSLQPPGIRYTLHGVPLPGLHSKTWCPAVLRRPPLSQLRGGHIMTCMSFCFCKQQRVS